MGIWERPKQTYTNCGTKIYSPLNITQYLGSSFQWTSWSYLHGCQTSRTILLDHLQRQCWRLVSQMCNLCSHQRTTDTVVRLTAQVQCGTPIWKNDHGSYWIVSNVAKGQPPHSCGGWLLQQMVRSISSANHRCPRNSQGLCWKLDFTLWCPTGAATQTKEGT